MGRIDEAQRRASEEGRPSAPAEVTRESPPWTFDDIGTSSAPAEVTQESPPWAFDGHATSSAPDGPRAVRPREAPRVPEAAPGHDGKPALFHALDSAAAERLVVSKSASPMLIEQFRVLAASLHHAQAAQTLRTVMVTSASVGDGKTLVATNLALTLSESFRRKVLLIDADLRRPSLHNVFRVPALGGLNEGLKATSDEMLPVVQLSETLALLPAGRPVLDPMAGLSSPRMKRVVEEAAARFDWVVVDTPPVGALADAAILSGMVDGVLLVVRAGVTPFPMVESAVAALGRDRILGLLLNAADPSDIHGRSYYDRYDGHGTGDPKSHR